MAPSSPSLLIPIPIPWHICVPPAHPIVPSTPDLSPDSRLMTRGSGAEPTPEVRPDNGVWGRLEGRGCRGEEEPPSSPIPSVEVTSRLAFQAAPTGHSPPARGDKDARPGSRIAAAPAPGPRATAGGWGRGEEHGGEDYPWPQPVPFFTAFNNKAVAIATGLINASDLHP